MSDSHSITPTSSGKPARPAKPYDNFPLFPHAAGVWAKKIRGKLHYFGPWNDPDGALDSYLRQKDALHAGRKPRPDPEALTIRDLANAFLNHKRALADAGEITMRMWAEYKGTTDLLVGRFGKGRLAEDVGPDDFAALRAEAARRWGPVSLGNFIQRVRCVFKFGADNGLLERAVRYGQCFARPSRKTLRLDRAAKGVRMFEAAEVRAMLAAAGPQLKAMILLGVNCGMGNGDCARLPASALDMGGGWVNFARPKTGIGRRCALWPETVQALREALANRPEPKDLGHAALVFITKYGAPWVRHTVQASGKVIVDDAVCKCMRKLLGDLCINGRRGFYCLRHTFETIGGEAKDQVAVDAVMGHARDDMASVYRERVSDERLRAVAEHVRAWLFGNVQ
jgi:integrase